MPDPKEHVKKLNEIMPKIPNMKWGALTNAYPTNAKLNELGRLLPHDKKWHSLFEEKDKIHIDGVTHIVQSLAGDCHQDKGSGLSGFSVSD